MPSDKPSNPIAANIKARKEAQDAAAGKTPAPVAGLKAAAPKPKAAPAPPPKSTSALVSDVDRLLAGYEDTTGVKKK